MDIDTPASSQHQRCSVCEQSRKPCICPHCCRKQLAADRRVLHALQTRREEVAGELQRALEEQVRAQVAFKGRAWLS